MSSSSVRRMLGEQLIQSSLQRHGMSLSVIFFGGNIMFGGSVIQQEEQSRAGGKRLMPGQARRETPGDEGRTNPWENRPGCWDTAGGQGYVLGLPSAIWASAPPWANTGSCKKPVQTAALAGPGPPPLTFLEGGHPGYSFCCF